VLVELGATWDVKCDELVSSGKARDEAPALRICVLLWTQEHVDGLPFTTIPVEAIRRGAASTQVYIHDLELEKKKNLKRLLKASEKGDVAAVRALLESGNVDVNGVDDGDWVRLLSAPRQTAAWLLCGKRVGAVDVVCGYKLTDGFITHEVSVWMDRTTLGFTRRSFAGRGAAHQGRR
jgi:hypothetical protein